MNLSEEDINRGIEKLKGFLVQRLPEYRWINIGQIAALCHPQPEDFGLPTLEQAWSEAQQFAHAVDRHSWTHLAVRLAGKRTGWFDILNTSSESGRKNLKKSFDRHYQYLADRVMRGKDLKDAQMLLESDQNKAPPSPEEQNLSYYEQKQQEQMQAMGINPAGGRAEFKQRMKGIL